MAKVGLMVEIWLDKWVLEVDKRILSVENTAYYVDLLFFAVSKGYSSSLSSELGVVLKYLVKHLVKYLGSLNPTS